MKVGDITACGDSAYNLNEDIGGMDDAQMTIGQRQIVNMAHDIFKEAGSNPNLAPLT